MRAATEGARPAPDQHAAMRTYAVTWQQGGQGTSYGCLELLSDQLRLNGYDGADPAGETVPYSDLIAVRVGRTASDRLSGRQTLVLERRGGLPIHIASVVHPGVVSELAELLTPHL